MELDRDITDIRAAIKAGRFGNEAAVSQGIVLRLLHSLGWPQYDTLTVSPQYVLEDRRVDYALCHPPSKPIAFVEVKKLGQSDGAERQLFEYAFHRGVQLAILTDGKDWNFFLPGERGDYVERRVYKLDLVERDIDECINRLTRYVGYEAVITGRAIEAAREDYRNQSREREMKATLPLAWKELVQEEDELLIELLTDRVETLCGYKPSPDTVAAFLRDHLSQYALAPTVSGTRRRQLGNLPVPSSPALPELPTPQPPRAPGQIGFILNGKQYPSRNAIDVLVAIIEKLTERDPSFPERFGSLHKHGRKRRYLARNPEELYPGRADLARDCSRQLASGWWLGTNHSRSTIGKIIERACDVGNVRYNEELLVNLG